MEDLGLTEQKGVGFQFQWVCAGMATQVNSEITLKQRKIVGTMAISNCLGETYKTESSADLCYSFPSTSLSWCPRLLHFPICTVVLALDHPYFLSPLIFQFSYILFKMGDQICRQCLRCGCITDVQRPNSGFTFSFVNYVQWLTTGQH